MTIQEALNLAVQHHNAGRLDQAEQLYRQILQTAPNQAETLHLLGVLKQQRGEVGLCVELIARAISIKPAVAVFHSNLAEAFRRLNLLDEAEAAARRAISISPDFLSAHANLAAIQSSRGQFDAAEQSLRRALQINPRDAGSMSALCGVLKDLGRVAEAIQAGRQAVALLPEDAVAHNNLAAALQADNQLAAAEAEYRKAVELHSGFVEAIDNLGTILYRQGNLRAAMVEWQRALALAPQAPGALWNLALAYIATGDWERGWPLFESRLSIGPSRMYFREYPGIPQWDGFDLKGKSILLFPEQGYGDVIQFARFIPVLAQRGARVIVHMPAEMVELMKLVPGVSQVVGPADQMPAFDTYRALMSVPLVLKVTPNSVPTNIPYFQPDESRRTQWKDRLAQYSEGKRIGIVWSGRPTHRDDARRSIALRELAPLAAIEGIQLISLQKGAAVEQLRSVPFADRIVNLDSELHDFADTAAAIANLDLVIAVDTAVAHLAGALGKPVWLLIASAPDYRWMLEREDSPWYPTMKIFRQKQPGDWTEVIARVSAKLTQI